MIYKIMCGLGYTYSESTFVFYPFFLARILGDSSTVTVIVYE